MSDCCSRCAEHGGAHGLGAILALPPPYPLGSAALAGFTALWTPMPPLASGFPVVPGYTYRAALTLGGLASTLGTASRIVSKAQTLGFAGIQVWMRGTPLPSDWTSPVSADTYVQAVCGKAQSFPITQSGGVWPLTGSVTVASALVFMWQPVGAPAPLPVPGALAPVAAGSAWVWALGIALAGGVAYGGYRLLQRHDNVASRRRRKGFFPHALLA